MRRLVVREKYRNEYGGLQLPYAVLLQAPVFAFGTYSALADPSWVGATLALVVTVIALVALYMLMHEKQKAETP